MNLSLNGEQSRLGELENNGAAAIEREIESTVRTGQGLSKFRVVQHADGHTRDRISRRITDQTTRHTGALGDDRARDQAPLYGVRTREQEGGGTCEGSRLGCRQHRRDGGWIGRKSADDFAESEMGGHQGGLNGQDQAPLEFGRLLGNGLPQYRFIQRIG